jgi:hypothetical protein
VALQQLRADAFVSLADAGQYLRDQVPTLQSDERAGEAVSVAASSIDYVVLWKSAEGYICGTADGLMFATSRQMIDDTEFERGEGQLNVSFAFMGRIEYPTSPYPTAERRIAIVRPYRVIFPGSNKAAEVHAAYAPEMRCWFIREQEPRIFDIA